MNTRDLAQADPTLEMMRPESADLLRPLMQGVRTPAEQILPTPGVQIGKLVAIVNEGLTPLVFYAGQPGSAALAARTTVDLHGAHIGKHVVLMFEGADPELPIVMGVLREGSGWPLAQQPAEIEVDADGERMLVSAKNRIVIRCGKASITLTSAGKVLIEGNYLLSRSLGVNRVKGGSVQLN
jgi:hypothetical protein